MFVGGKQPRPQGAFPWLWEKRPGDEVGWKNNKVILLKRGSNIIELI